MKTTFILMLATTLGLSCAAQTTDLSLKLKKGEAYKQISTTKTMVGQEIQGQKIDVELELTGDMTFTVKEVSEQAYQMNVNFDHLSMAMQMPQMAINASSDNEDPNDILSSVFASVINNPFELTMQKTGKVTEVKNVEALWESTVDQFSQLSEPQKAQIKAQVIESYGANALKGNIEMATAIYPDKPVKKGDTWTITTQLQSEMPAEVVSVYEFVDLTAEYVLIKGTGNIKTVDAEKYTESNGMEMRYDLTGSMTSEIKVDRVSGWIVEANIHQELKGKTYIKASPQMPDGMEIPLTIVNETRMTN